MLDALDYCHKQGIYHRWANVVHLMSFSKRLSTLSLRPHHVLAKLTKQSEVLALKN